MKSQDRTSARSLLNFMLFLVLLIFTSVEAYARLQDPLARDPNNAQPAAGQPAVNSQNPKAGQAAPASSLALSDYKAQVLDIRVGEIFDSTNHSTLIRVNYKVQVLVRNPRGLLAQRPMDRSQLILYADQLPLKGINTSYFNKFSKNDIADKVKVWPDKLWIPFIFSRDSTNKEAWNSLFKVTGWDKNMTHFSLSVGWDGMFPLEYGNPKLNDKKFNLVLYNAPTFWTLLVLYVAFLGLFIWLCHKTGLIREPDRLGSTLGPFSLAQTQLAFWTVIILGGFIYLTILTGLPDSLNESSLVLLGITGGTTGVAGLIDVLKKKARDDNAAATKDPNRANFIKPKQGFLKDIISDGINVNVQRTQTVMWNLVLGVYFIWYVIFNKAMPVFSNTLLTLAGVSSLLYLSSKGPEKPSPYNPPPLAGTNPAAAAGPADPD